MMVEEPKPASQLPGMHGRHFRVGPEVHLGAHHGRPVGKAELGGERVDVGVVLGVELLEVVGRQAGRAIALGAGEADDEGARGLREGDLEGHVIDLFELGRHGLAVDGHAEVRGQTAEPAIEALARVEVLVEGDVLEPEQDVVDGVGLAVGPLQALAQVQHIFGGIGVDVVALGEAGHGLLVVVEAIEQLGADEIEQRPVIARTARSCGWCRHRCRSRRRT